MTRDPLWLDGLDVLITGGSSGIGRAIARRCVETGAHVHLVARDATRLVDAQRELLGACVRPRQEVTWSACDVTSTEAVDVLFARLQQIGFVPELVVNSAGIGMPGTFFSLSLGDYERAMQVHYVGTLRILDRVIPGMVARKRGDILNIGSIAALLGVYGLSAYCASKFAIRGFTESLRYELKPHGVSVSLLCPPDTETPMLVEEVMLAPPATAALTARAGLMSADRVARAALAGLRRRQALIIPGLEGKATALAQRWFPGLVERICDRVIEQAVRDVES